MASSSTGSAVPAPSPSGGGSAGTGAGGLGGTGTGTGGGGTGTRRHGVTLTGEDGLLSRVLALREGSIIVVTVVVAIYFALNTSQLLHLGELQDAAAVLRAVRDPRGGRGVRDDPRRDRPLDRRHVSARPVSLLQALRDRRPAARPGRDRRADRLYGGRPDQRLLHGDRRHQLVRGHARHAVRAGGADAGDLPRRARRDARRPGARDHPRGHPCGQRRADPPPRTGQPHQHVRENLRRRHLLGADLGARDRDRPADRADVHALGPAHGRGRLEQARRRARPGCE